MSDATVSGRVRVSAAPVEQKGALERLTAAGVIEPATHPGLELPEPICGTGGASDLVAAQRR